MTGEKLLDALGAVGPELAADARQAGKKRRPVRRLTAGLLAAALVLALGVGAAAYYGDVLLDHFAWMNGKDLTEEQIATVRALTAVVGQSQTVDGWTVTVDRALATRHNAYIELDLTAPAGTVVDPERQHYDCDVELSGFNTADTSDEGVTGCGMQVEMFKEEGMAENESTVLLTLDRTATAASKLDLADGRSRTLTIKDLCLRELDEQGHRTDTPLVRGTWRFTFTLPKAEEIELLDDAASVWATDPATKKREEVGVSSFRLTALGATCEYITAYDYIQPFDDLTVTMADGTAVMGRVKGNSARDFGKVCSFVFDVPIDLDQVAYVSFQGLKLPMPE